MSLGQCGWSGRNKGNGEWQQSCPKSPVSPTWKQTSRHSPAGGARDPGGSTLGPPGLVIGITQLNHSRPQRRTHHLCWGGLVSLAAPPQKLERAVVFGSPGFYEQSPG